MLTNRERDILVLAARGNTNQNIADELGISCRTVKCILHHACGKLRAQNRTQALFVALSQGYIGIGEVFSEDKLVLLFSSLGTELMNAVTEQLKQQGSHLPSNPDSASYIRVKRPSKPDQDSKLVTCTEARLN